MAKHDLREVIEAASSLIEKLRASAAEFEWKPATIPGVAESVATGFTGWRGSTCVTVMKYNHGGVTGWDGALTCVNQIVRLPAADAQFVYEAAEKKVAA